MRKPSPRTRRRRWRIDNRITAILRGLAREPDGIYTSPISPVAIQADEIRERQAVAVRTTNLLDEVSRHHSIRVMDRELRMFLRTMPAGGVIADIGAGWAWPWRRVDIERPDVAVVAVDFVRENLRNAARLLGALVDTQVFLVHGDATALPFPPSVFDGYWSVQALQHVPDFERAIVEAQRVMRPAAVFASYSLNRAPLIELAYRVMGKSYHVSGKRPGSFYLTRGSREQAAVVGRVFDSAVTTRYSEVLFHPDLRLRTGEAGSRLARIDEYLSGRSPVLAAVARQRSYHVRKRRLG